MARISEQLQCKKADVTSGKRGSTCQP